MNLLKRMSECTICYSMATLYNCSYCDISFCPRCSSDSTWACSLYCKYEYMDKRAICGFEYICKWFNYHNSKELIILNQREQFREIEYINQKLKNFSYFELKKFVINDLAKVILNYLEYAI